MRAESNGVAAILARRLFGYAGLLFVPLFLVTGFPLFVGADDAPASRLAFVLPKKARPEAVAEALNAVAGVKMVTAAEGGAFDVQVDKGKTVTLAELEAAAVKAGGKGTALNARKTELRGSFKVDIGPDHAGKINEAIMAIISTGKIDGISTMNESSVVTLTVVKGKSITLDRLELAWREGLGVDDAWHPVSVSMEGEQPPDDETPVGHAKGRRRECDEGCEICK